ncbi:CLUMA_CG000315, isoform A [Clunio marinus]|uniref:CLUMA_CG000315, isoform A n=1 Tax=Clunio marinus TaxID=568069 RepID=A0A1J1HF02_9DIPT|nr:CLUMA_CG000315, isoform A [Clunio marinus]
MDEHLHWNLNHKILASKKMIEKEKSFLAIPNRWRNIYQHCLPECLSNVTVNFRKILVFSVVCLKH